MTKQTNTCPLGHGELKIVKIISDVNFRDTDISYEDTHYVCATCDIEISTIEQAGQAQKNIADAYRLKIGLLTSEEIRTQRKKYNFTQASLAAELSLGVASIKRWETGEIQSASMDSALRHLFTSKQREFSLSGGRSFSIPRIKLVLQTFEGYLNQKIMLKSDKFLFAGKYAWYADMVSFRDLNKSMTGANYAALPYGPQLNNYKDLIDEIKKSDLSTVEPLSGPEKAIIKKVAKNFPKQRMAYDASHRESIWKNTQIGHTIEYTSANLLTEL